MWSRVLISGLDHDSGDDADLLERVAFPDTKAKVVMSRMSHDYEAICNDPLAELTSRLAFFWRRSQMQSELIMANFQAIREHSPPLRCA